MLAHLKTIFGWIQHRGQAGSPGGKVYGANKSMFIRFGKLFSVSVAANFVLVCVLNHFWQCPLSKLRNQSFLSFLYIAEKNLFLQLSALTFMVFVKFSSDQERTISIKRNVKCER